MTSIGSISKLNKSTEFQWIIPNFSNIPATKGFSYISPSFDFANSSFHLSVYPAGYIDSDDGFMSVFLNRNNGKSFHANCKFSMKTGEGKLIKVSGSTNVYIKGFAGYSNFYSRSALLQEISNSPPCPISITCCLEVIQEGSENAIKAEVQKELTEIDTIHLAEIKELNILSKNLKDLFSNADSCDIVLEVQDKEFRAHKIILMARSPVFAAMFRHDTLEMQSGVIKIPDCDPDSFHEFLEYLYCGCIKDVSFRSAFQLFITSNKYEVMELKASCIKYLIKNLTADNVSEVFMLADTYGETVLLSTVQSFFNQNCKKIFLSKEWKNLMKENYHLANKLLVGFSRAEESH